MDSLLLIELKSKMYEMGNLINVNSNLYPGFILNGAEGYYLYVENGFYHYLYTERGKEEFHYLSKDIDEILYPIFQNITFSMASRFEVENRIKNQDSRRIFFDKQLELLGNLNPMFRTKRLNEINDTLSVNPYNDTL